MDTNGIIADASDRLIICQYSILDTSDRLRVVYYYNCWCIESPENPHPPSQHTNIPSRSIDRHQNNQSNLIQIPILNHLTVTMSWSTICKCHSNATNQFITNMSIIMSLQISGDLIHTWDNVLRPLDHNGVAGTLSGGLSWTGDNVLRPLDHNGVAGKTFQWVIMNRRCPKTPRPQWSGRKNLPVGYHEQEIM
jgi:hypothetical protein